MTRFVTRAVLGSGWLGTVYRALDRASGHDVAVKMLRPEIFNNQESRNRLTAACRQGERLNHPGLLRIIQKSAPASNYPSFASELSDGLSFRRAMEKRAEKNQPFTFAEVARLIAHTADALDVLYSGLPGHGLLKPENLFVLPGLVRITDYHLGASLPIRVLAGAPDQKYLAPEVQVLVPLSPASDVYSLALIMVEMLGGPGALNRKRLGLARPDLPAGLQPLLRRCLEEDPGARPKTPRELAGHLAAILENAAGGRVAQAPIPILRGRERS
jgi:serine/threonine-protein kinase